VLLVGKIEDHINNEAGCITIDLSTVAVHILFKIKYSDEVSVRKNMFSFKCFVRGSEDVKNACDE
jgi:uncharacterized protein (UPF0262 family)